MILGDNMCYVDTINNNNNNNNSNNNNNNNNNNSIYLYSTISPELQFCSEALVTTLA